LIIIRICTICDHNFKIM